MATTLGIKYEITRSDYAEANAAVIGRIRKSHAVDTALSWGAAGILLVLPLSYKADNPLWVYPFLVVPFAVYMGYVGLLFLVPSLNARMYYKFSGLVNRSFKAEFSDRQIVVQGDHQSWVVEWPAFTIIKESERLFVFYDGITMFIFAKRHFQPEQVSLLQQLISECWNVSKQSTS